MNSPSWMCKSVPQTPQALTTRLLSARSTKFRIAFSHLSQAHHYREQLARGQSQCHNALASSILEFKCQLKLFTQFHPDLVGTKNDDGKELSFLATSIAHRKFVERGGVLVQYLHVPKSFHFLWERHFGWNFRGWFGKKN
jgi:hypothetical protein